MIKAKKPKRMLTVSFTIEEKYKKILLKLAKKQKTSLSDVTRTIMLSHFDTDEA